MATFATFNFATEKYGPKSINWNLYNVTGTDLPATTRVDYEVDPIVAEPLDYEKISISWTSPSGSWTGLRLVKSYSGWSVTEDDGEILLDTANPARSLVDVAVRPGAWHYYSLWVKSAGLWQCAGGTSVVMVCAHGYGQRLFDHLPLHHKTLGVDGNDTHIQNETLKKFLNVLGWGLDTIKTNLDSLQNLNDPQTNHVSNLARLADQLGVTYEPSTSSRLFRQRVRNAAVLGREKGTLEQIQSLISITTGLDVELSLSANRMLNEDAAAFAHPIYPLYSLLTHYLVDERVRCEGHVYQCSVAGAYGFAEKPTGVASSNTFWAYLLSSPDVTLIDSDGAVAGWEPTHYTGTANPSMVLTLGAPSFRDATDLTTNALRVLNTTGLTADLGARSIAKRFGETTTDPGQVFKFGTPIPVPLTYDVADTYQRDTLVNFDGKVYRALRELQGIAPNGGLIDDTNWEIIGLDDRVKVALSVHAKAGNGGFIVPAYPVIDFYDELGQLVVTVDTEKETAAGSKFDSFGNRYGPLAGRTLDNGALSWTVQAGLWTVSDHHGGVSWPTTTGLITIPGTADGVVSTTFGTPAAGASNQYVAVRGSGATTFLKATKTALYSRLNGVDTLLDSYSTPFTEGDRITINLVGTSIIIRRHGVVVLSVASAFNQTSTLHGLGVA